MPKHRRGATTPQMNQRRPNPQGANGARFRGIQGGQGRTEFMNRRVCEMGHPSIYHFSEPQGHPRIANDFCVAPRARCKASAPSARLEARTGSHGGCVLSAAGSAVRRRDADDPFRSPPSRGPSRGDAADDPPAARTLRACGHCGRIRRREPRPMRNGIESRLATGLRPQAPHAQPPWSPVRASNILRKPRARGPFDFSAPCWQP